MTHSFEELLAASARRPAKALHMAEDREKAVTSAPLYVAQVMFRNDVQPREESRRL